MDQFTHMLAMKALKHHGFDPVPVNGNIVIQIPREDGSYEPRTLASDDDHRRFHAQYLKRGR